MEDRIRSLPCEGLQTIREALIAGARLLDMRDIETARLDAEILLCHALGVEKTELHVHSNRMLNAAEVRRYEELLRRRENREPIAYIFGGKEFWSLDFIVTPEVLIPRPETEKLLEVALAWATEQPVASPFKILDLGTGSGAIAICLALELPQAEIWAVDIFASALAIARLNGERHGVGDRIRFLQGDLFEPVAKAGGIFSLIVSNPPYVKSCELLKLAPEVRAWEPASALDGGIDGLNYYRRIIDRAGSYLKPGGQILFEVGADMGGAVAQLVAQAHCFGPVRVHKDYAGRDRVVGATKLSLLDPMTTELEHG